MPDGGSLVVTAYKDLIDSVEKDAQALEEKVAASRAQMAVRAARKK